MGRYSTRFTGFFISCLLLAGCSGAGNPSSIAPIAPIPPMPLGRPDSRIVGFAYVPNAFGNNISAYTMKANGSLSPVAGSPFSTGSEPWGAVVDPKGKFIYVTNLSSNNVSAYTINVTTGALHSVAGSPFAT
ncbi:MAG: beta-propeller fold lactonase family protein, partial [Candidatus Cybelea sp.]